MRYSLLRISSMRQFRVQLTNSAACPYVMLMASPTRVSTDCQHMNQEGGHSTIPTPLHFQRLFFSVKSSNPQQTELEQRKRKCRNFLDKRIHPPGSYTSSLCTEAKDVLDFFKHEKVTDKDAVDMSIALIERLVEESAISKNASASAEWVCRPLYIHPLLRNWKEAARRGKGVTPPQDLAHKLQAMSRMHAEFRYDIVAFNTIMDVAMKQAPPEKAPFVAEDLLKLLRKHASETQNEELRPNVFTYNNIMQAWAVSGLPESAVSMDIFLHAMRQEVVVPTAVTYNILLRYWADKSAVDRMEAVLEAMKGDGLDPTRSRMSLSPAIYGYARMGETAKAEEMLNKLTEIQSKDANEAARISRMIGESVQTILLEYRRIVEDRNATNAQKERAVQSSEALFEKMSKSTQLTDENQSKSIQ